MQTLKFDTTNKVVKLYSGHLEDSSILLTYENIPTVKVTENGFYEVHQWDENNKAIPVLRVPISNTNMVIIK
jgi:hypothetical protein